MAYGIVPISHDRPLYRERYRVRNMFYWLYQLGLSRIGKFFLDIEALYVAWSTSAL